MSKFSELSIREQGKIQGRIQGLACAAQMCRLNTGQESNLIDLANAMNAEMRQLISYMREEENAHHYQDLGNDTGSEEKAPHSAPALKRA